MCSRINILRDIHPILTDKYHDVIYIPHILTPIDFQLHSSKSNYIQRESLLKTESHTMIRKTTDLKMALMKNHPTNQYVHSLVLDFLSITPMEDNEYMIILTA